MIIRIIEHHDETANILLHSNDKTANILYVIIILLLAAENF